MNKITKKSFYSFLALYLISSFIFLALAAYWFFNSQVSLEMSSNFYKMVHIADNVSSKIISASSNNKSYTLEQPKHASIALLDKDKKLIQGYLNQKVDVTKEFYDKDDVFTLISKRASGHLGIEYIVVQSGECNQNINELKNEVAYTVIITAFLIITIAVFLSYIFLKPLRDKMHEIEEFVKDTTHELNTPITALMMSTSRLQTKKEYDDKSLKNITISTKQLYDIYSSLSFLSFDNKSEQAQTIYFDDVIRENISYFSELLEKKNIKIIQNLQECKIDIAPTKAKMLINNLLGNSIKYSKPNSTITLSTNENSFTIKDEGIGIAKDKLQEIFTRFVRANSYAGGFGIGLNIVDSIIKEYDYHIDIQSTENIGTTVTINFSQNSKK